MVFLLTKKGFSSALVLIFVLVSLFSSFVAAGVSGYAVGDTDVLGPNLIPNGNFQQDLHFWENSIPANRIEIVKGDLAAPSGLPYLKLTGGGYQSIGTNRPGLWAEGTYRLSFYARAFGNKAYANIGMTYNYAHNSNYGFANGDGKTIPDTWTKYQYDVLLPANNNRINFSVQCDGGTGYFCLSDISIKRVLSAAPTYQPTATPAPVPEITAAPGVDRSKNYVYILMGQSNMAGINTSDPQDLLCDARIQKMSQTNYDTWMLGTENMNSNSTGGGTSPGKTIAEQLLTQVPNDVTIRMVGAAASGSSVEQWSKGSTNNDYNKAAGNLYNDLVLRIHAAQRIGIIKGIFWHQGEANSGTTDYEQKLTKLISDVRNEIGTPNVTYVMGQIGITGDATGVVNRSLDLIKYFVPNTNFATCEGLVLADNVHYNAASQRIYGVRYANAYLALNPELIPPATPTPTPSPTPTQTPTPSPTPTQTPTPSPTPTETPTPTPTPTISPTPTPTPTPVAISGLQISKTSASLKVPAMLQLTASVLPANATNKLIIWTSSNNIIATVSAGKVTAKGPGIVTISAKSADGSFTKTCKITVTMPVKSVKLSKTSLFLKKGSTHKLIVTIAPVNASNKKVNWKSSNTKIATVTSNGTVKAKAKGTAYISVVTLDGKKTAKCKVSVK